MDLPLSYIFGYLSDELFIERSKRIYATVRLKARFACPNETRRFRPARSSLCPAVRGDADLTYATLQLFQELTPPPTLSCGGEQLRRATKHQHSHRTNGVPRWNHSAATDFSAGAGRPACMARRSRVSPGASSKKL